MINKLRVMLIDDNEFDLFLMEKLLVIKEISSSVIKFLYAGSALDYLAQCADIEWPQLIILDIHMPVMSGFEFLEKFEKFEEKKRIQCLIIMISSSLDITDNQNALKNPNVLKLLNKPINMEELQETLHEKGFL